MDKQYHKKWKKARQEKGLCSWCPNKVCDQSKIFCQKCLEKKRLINRQSWARHSAEYKRQKPQLDKAQQRYHCLKHRAKKHNIEFSLDRVAFIEWFNSQAKLCHYCGVTEEFLLSRGRKKCMLTVDRCNNSLGYCLNNICLACFRCNNLKSNFFTEQEWSNIANNYIKPRLEEYHVKP